MCIRDSKKAAVPKKVWPVNVIASARALSKSLGTDLLEAVFLGNSAEMVEVNAGILAELIMAIADIPEDEECAAPDASQLDMLGGDA